ncbi:MAG TPA: hypothetical protein VNE41_11090 [Chitinophagaceae bacterium]|nr:hypothetical protein [Chitinophagaceae bacterium]
MSIARVNNSGEGASNPYKRLNIDFHSHKDSFGVLLFGQERIL